MSVPVVRSRVMSVPHVPTHQAVTPVCVKQDMSTTDQANQETVLVSTGTLHNIYIEIDDDDHDDEDDDHDHDDHDEKDDFAQKNI